MKEVSPYYMCSLCKGEFRFENIRYSPDGKRVVCVACYNQIKKQEGQKIKKDEDKPISKSGALKLRCIDCGYKFSFKTESRLNKACPYCGKSRFIEDESIVDKLINESVSQRNYSFH